MRWTAAFMALAALASTNASTAQTPNSNKSAYTITLICAVVASESKNDADIQRTMEAARKMGRVQGFDTARVSSDLTKMAGALGVERRSDPNAAARDRALCQRMKLVS